MISICKIPWNMIIQGCPACPTQAACGPGWLWMLPNTKSYIYFKAFFFFFADPFSLVFVYLMCDPRQLFLFPCGTEMPKVWTLLLGHLPLLPCSLEGDRAVWEVRSVPVVNLSSAEGLQSSRLHADHKNHGLFLFLFLRRSNLRHCLNLGRSLSFYR